MNKLTKNFKKWGAIIGTGVAATTAMADQQDDNTYTTTTSDNAMTMRVDASTQAENNFFTADANQSFDEIGQKATEKTPDNDGNNTPKNDGDNGPNSDFKMGMDIGSGIIYAVSPEKGFAAGYNIKTGKGMVILDNVLEASFDTEKEQGEVNFSNGMQLSFDGQKGYGSFKIKSGDKYLYIVGDKDSFNGDMPNLMFLSNSQDDLMSAKPMSAKEFDSMKETMIDTMNMLHDDGIIDKYKLEDMMKKTAKENGHDSILDSIKMFIAGPEMMANGTMDAVFQARNTQDIGGYMLAKTVGANSGPLYAANFDTSR